MEDRDGALFGMFPWDDVLELEEAAFSVHPVPMEDLVERIKEGLVVLLRDGAFVYLLMEVCSVEEADAEVIEGEAGGVEGKDKLWFGRRFEFAPPGRVVALHE